MDSWPGDFPNVLSREEAEKILMPWKSAIEEAIFFGWKSFWRWQDEDDEFYATISPRTRASIVHDFAIKKIKLLLGGMESKGIRIRPEFGSVLLIFGEELVLRIKKFDDAEKANNSRTKRQYLFDRQCLNLPGIPTDSTKVTAGYKLNRDQTEIAKISATCWCVNSLRWSIGIWEEDSGGTMLEFPSPIPDSPDKPKKPIVRPNLNKGKADETGN